MTFLSSSKSKRLKEALERADNEILKLKDQVKSLQESNKQLCIELATSRDKVDDLAARFHDIEREKRRQDQQGTGSSEQHGVGDGASDEEIKEQSPMSGDDSIGEEAQMVTNGKPNEVGEDKQLYNSETSSNINGNIDKRKEMSDATNDTTYRKEGELILQINELTKRNQELEAKVTSLSDERERLIAIRSKDDEVAGSPSVSFEIAEKKEEALIIPTSTPGRASRKQQTDQELEAQVASLTIERDKLVTTLVKEKNKSQVASLTLERDKLVTMLAKEQNKSKQRRDEAKERRKRFQDKLSKMSDKLKGDFDDEEDTDET